MRKVKQMSQTTKQKVKHKTEVEVNERSSTASKMTVVLKHAVVNHLATQLMLLILADDCNSVEELAEKSKELILKNNPLKNEHSLYSRLMHEVLNDEELDWIQIVQFIWDHPIEKHIASTNDNMNENTNDNTDDDTDNENRGN